VLRLAAASGIALLLLTACDGAQRTAETLPRWSYDSTMVFPPNRSLTKPEDGIALPDGRLLVTDAVSGLRMIELGGASRPFGEMVAAGYVHNPPAWEGGANGISLEPDGTHALVTDVHGGTIYRVDVATGGTDRVYQHTYGINAAVRDSRGAIWFTQSAHNTRETGPAAMWAAVDAARAEGALLRLPMNGARGTQPEIVVDSLIFANGIAIDERRGYLYLSEMMAGRVLRYRVDLATGTLSERTVVLEGHAVDNVELDEDGNVWVVAPLDNALIVLNSATGVPHTAFRQQTPEQEARAAEFERRGERGASRLELLAPEAWAPLPGFITGVILTPRRGPLYLTGLGDALVRLQR
jgi:sugar lactone lactonase YvrE